jgi:hypothetical protein
VGIILVFLSVAVLIVASPLILILVDTDNIDWNRLSSIGQSYGAVSALLSAAAVGGVVLALIVQNEQSRDIRRFEIRELHRELLKMAIDRPILLQAWGNFPAREVGDPSLVVYTNLVLNYFVLLHQTGTATLDEIKGHLSFIANSEWMQTYWAETAQTWRTGYRGRAQEIIELIDEEFSRVHGARPAKQGPVQ